MQWAQQYYLRYSIIHLNSRSVREIHENFFVLSKTHASEKAITELWAINGALLLSQLKAMRK